MYRQAIVTKYLGPTNTKGGRVKAQAEAGSITLHWDPALNPNANHWLAMKALAEKLGWHGEWQGGFLPDGSYVFVHTGRAT